VLRSTAARRPIPFRIQRLDPLTVLTESGLLVGGLGVSGDSSCADHNIAWRVRDSLNLDTVPTV
jgi:hypothetical protein